MSDLVVLHPDVVNELRVELQEGMLKDAAQRDGEDDVQRPLEGSLPDQLVAPQSHLFVGTQVSEDL